MYKSARVEVDQQIQVVKTLQRVATKKPKNGTK